jgi:hypothetical protein
MTDHVEHEPTTRPTELTTQVSELTPDEMEQVSGGLFLVFTFKLVAVKTIS